MGLPPPKARVAPHRALRVVAVRYAGAEKTGFDVDANHHPMIASVERCYQTATACNVVIVVTCCHEIEMSSPGWLGYTGAMETILMCQREAIYLFRKGPILINNPNAVSLSEAPIPDWFPPAGNFH